MRTPVGRGRRVTLIAALILLVASPVAVGAACSASEEATGYVPRTRTYYLAADEVRWDYLAGDGSAGLDTLTGKPFGDTENTFVLRSPDRIGSTYIKSLYREYTDDTFGRLKPRPPQWQHLGMLGPALRAVVGDRVDIVFKNNLDHPAGIHMHGLQYTKDSEGAPYVDGAGGERRADGQVAPGAIHTYHYTVPERAGPARWIPVPSCGCTTRTPTRSVTITPG